MSGKIIPPLLKAGYVETAPACGDCHWSTDQPQGLFCIGHLVLVQDSGRCKKWAPAAHWLCANPLVAPYYTTNTDALSPAEQVYAYKEHTL